MYLSRSKICFLNPHKELCNFPRMVGGRGCFHNWTWRNERFCGVKDGGSVASKWCTFSTLSRDFWCFTTGWIEMSILLSLAGNSWSIADPLIFTPTQRLDWPPTSFVAVWSDIVHITRIWGMATNLTHGPVDLLQLPWCIVSIWAVSKVHSNNRRLFCSSSGDANIHGWSVSWGRMQRVQLLHRSQVIYFFNTLQPHSFLETGVDFLLQWK
jgi:hypothetical protein